MPLDLRRDALRFHRAPLVAADEPEGTFPRVQDMVAGAGRYRPHRDNLEPMPGGLWRPVFVFCLESARWPTPCTHRSSPVSAPMMWPSTGNAPAIANSSWRCRKWANGSRRPSANRMISRNSKQSFNLAKMRFALLPGRYRRATATSERRFPRDHRPYHDMLDHEMLTDARRQARQPPYVVISRAVLTELASQRKPQVCSPSSRSTVPSPSGGAMPARNAPILPVGMSQISTSIGVPAPAQRTKPGRLPSGSA